MPLLLDRMMLSVANFWGSIIETVALPQTSELSRNTPDQESEDYGQARP